MLDGKKTSLGKSWRMLLGYLLLVCSHLYEAGGAKVGESIPIEIYKKGAAPYIIRFFGLPGRFGVDLG